jgi:hypothetical protein
MLLIELFNTIEKNINLGKTLKECMTLLEDYNASDYKQYVKQNAKKYNRQIVYKNDTIELVIITWSKDQSSGFHSHPGECIFKVLENNMSEIIKKNEKIIQTNIYNINDIGYIDNNIGIHNMLAMDDSVTIHLYSPTF